MKNPFPAFAGRVRPEESSLLDPSVGAEGDRLRGFLANAVPAGLSAEQIRAEVEGNLWMLAPRTFQYFLPAFMTQAVEHYDPLAVFAAELIGALTEPRREDVVESLDRLAKVPVSAGITEEIFSRLREQQLEWFDSGKPLSTFRDRLAGMDAEEGSAIVDFLAAMRDDHGKDFPFNEPQIAIDRLRALGF